MKKEEWVEIQNRGPGQFIDFVSCHYKKLSGKLTKRTLTEIEEDVAKSLGGMANADGGTIFLGVESEGEVTGVSFTDRAKRSFLAGLKNSFTPSLFWQVEEEEVDGIVLLKFTIAPSPGIHFLKDGKCYLRVGERNIPLSRERVVSLKEARIETWHEREILPGSSLKDLDQDLIAEFIDQSGMQGEAESILYRPYGLITYRDGRPLLTRAAAYLFAKDPLRWHPRPGIEFVRFEGTEKGGEGEYNVLERLRVESPILKLVKEMEKRIGEGIKERLLVRDLFFHEKFEYPAWVWKEGLVNAMAHRDYRLEGSPIELWMFEDRLEIRSPGKLPRPGNLSQLLRQEKFHYSRNPLITRALVDSGAMRGLGFGFPQIFQVMDHHGLNPPELREEGEFFCLLLRKTPVFDEKTQSWLERFSGHRLNLRQKRILAYARAHGMIFSSSDYQDLGVDRDAAYTEIRDLIRQQIVRPLREHSKVYRILGVESRAAALPGLTWVLDALTEKGFFIPADLKQPASVSRETALEMMRELVQQGYLTVSGKGRWMRFFPTDLLKSLLERKG